MNEGEKFDLLLIIRSNQGTVGVSRTELFTWFNVHTSYPIDVVNALIDLCIEDGNIEVRKYGDERFLLSSKGFIWLREAEFSRKKEALTQSAYSVANSSAENVKPKKDWGKSGAIGTWASLIVTVLLFGIGLLIQQTCSKEKNASQKHQNAAKQNSNVEQHWRDTVSVPRR